MALGTLSPDAIRPSGSFWMELSPAVRHVRLNGQRAQMGTDLPRPREWGETFGAGRVVPVSEEVASGAARLRSPSECRCGVVEVGHPLPLFVPFWDRKAVSATPNSLGELSPSRMKPSASESAYMKTPGLRVWGNERDVGYSGRRVELYDPCTWLNSSRTGFGAGNPSGKNLRLKCLKMAYHTTPYPRGISDTLSPGLRGWGSLCCLFCFCTLCPVLLLFGAFCCSRPRIPSFPVALLLRPVWAAVFETIELN